MEFDFVPTFNVFGHCTPEWILLFYINWQVTLGSVVCNFCTTFVHTASNELNFNPYFLRPDCFRLCAKTLVRRKRAKELVGPEQWNTEKTRGFFQKIFGCDCLDGVQHTVWNASSNFKVRKTLWTSVVRPCGTVQQFSSGRTGPVFHQLFFLFNYSLIFELRETSKNSQITEYSRKSVSNVFLLLISNQ